MQALSAQVFDRQVVGRRKEPIFGIVKLQQHHPLLQSVKPTLSLLDSFGLRKDGLSRLLLVGSGLSNKQTFETFEVARHTIRLFWLLELLAGLRLELGSLWSS
jgi:hypothetical protein